MIEKSTHDSDTNSPLTDPKHQASLDAMDQWLIRITNRMHLAYRSVELNLSDSIVRNELSLVHKSVFHLAACINTAMEPVENYLADLQDETIPPDNSEKGNDYDN